MQKELVNYDKAGSYCSFSSHDFALETAQKVIDLLKPFCDGQMEVNVYTPPHNNKTLPDGFLRICFWKNDSEYKQLGISFSQSNIQEQHRQSLNTERWLKYPDDPHTSGIFANNFDEAWRIVCIIGENLRIKVISLSYGC